ncbi:MAG: hypothetical protein R6W76_14990 [Caldilinea sp.]
MKILLLTLPLLALPLHAADDLPPPRTTTQDATIDSPDDLPPPRTTTRKPRVAPVEVRGGGRSSGESIVTS